VAFGGLKKEVTRGGFQPLSTIFRMIVTKEFLFQVNLIHVASTCKNAADEKLRQSIRRFAEIYGSPAAIILISGDVNFAADLCDLRHR